MKGSPQFSQSLAPSFVKPCSQGKEPGRVVGRTWAHVPSSQLMFLGLGLATSPCPTRGSGVKGMFLGFPSDLVSGSESWDESSGPAEGILSFSQPNHFTRTTHPWPSLHCPHQAAGASPDVPVFSLTSGLLHMFLSWEPSCPVYHGSATPPLRRR